MEASQVNRLLESPGNSADLVHGKIGAEAEEDAKRCPHLPTHLSYNVSKARVARKGS